MDPIEPEDVNPKGAMPEPGALDAADTDVEFVEADEIDSEMEPLRAEESDFEEDASSVDEDLVDPTEVLDIVEFDEMQAQRTQVISTADLSPIEDDDHGHLQAEHAPSNEPPEVSPGRAHECLEIRTPLEEFETYVRARIETLTRLGETEQVELMLNALELGKQKLGGSIVRRP